MFLSQVLFHMLTTCHILVTSLDVCSAEMCLLGKCTGTNTLDLIIVTITLKTEEV